MKIETVQNIIHYSMSTAVQPFSVENERWLSGRSPRCHCSGFHCIDFNDCFDVILSSLDSLEMTSNPFNEVIIVTNGRMWRQIRYMKSLHQNVFYPKGEYLFVDLDHQKFTRWRGRNLLKEVGNCRHCCSWNNIQIHSSVWTPGINFTCLLEFHSLRSWNSSQTREIYSRSPRLRSGLVVNSYIKQ